MAQSRDFRQIEAEGMGLRYKLEGTIIEAVLSAPTQGWVAVGVSCTRGLSAGMRFVMMRADAKAGYWEEHRARPPHHHRVEGGVRAHVLKVSQARGHTRAHLLWQLDPDENECATRMQGIYIMLAFSESSDFQHHSRAREHLLAPL